MSAKCCHRIAIEGVRSVARRVIIATALETRSKLLEWSSRESTCTPPARLSHLIVAPVNEEHSAGLRRSKSLQNS